MEKIAESYVNNKTDGKTDEEKSKQSHKQTEGHLYTVRNKESTRQRDKQIITQLLYDR